MALQHYNHTQSTPSTTWTIVHNLNADAVGVDVIIGGEIILPNNVVEIDSNTVEITFSTPFTGSARVMAHTS